ncbi:peptidase T4 [Neoasaia chiangmaiensis]|uniref:Peptidase T4 n=2 Tax=Neoasaia chiangmaiensis TaxID=320497 RepID=A0A1U9KUD7_9PROT|nr:peptidase T4 [Neoasaia chiangmaiensis]
MTRGAQAQQQAGGPGQRNAITDVAGLTVGQAQDEQVRSGVTVILPDQRATAAVDVRGGGPGTRETDALAPWNLVRSVDAIVLSGGSVYGLAAADGVAAWLGAQGRGFALGHKSGVPVSPIVPTAILYDLDDGGNKNWGFNPPYRDLGLRAVRDTHSDVALGTVGAGYGATAGSLKGGIGTASYVTHDGITVGAIVACNSVGSVVMPETRRFWAAPFEIGREFGGLGLLPGHAAAEDWGDAKINPSPRANTTIACIATDADLDSDECKRVAIMAQDGLARAIRPAHSPFDGDTIFTLATARRPLPSGARALLTARIGALAGDVLARAIARAVYEARLPPGMGGRSWSMLRD